MVRAIVIIIFSAFFISHGEEELITKKYIYNFWVLDKQGCYDNVMAFRSFDSYPEGSLPSNEGFRFRRFGRYENIRAVNKCSFTDCKPSDTAKWKWRKKGDVKYIEIRSDDATYNYYRVVFLNKKRLEMIPCRTPG